MSDYALENPDSVTFVLEDLRPQTWNSLKRAHWSDWQTEVFKAAILMRHAYGPNPPYFTKPVDIEMVTYFAGRMYDSSNLPVKLYEDGLKTFVIEDDDLRYVRRITTESRRDNDRPRIEITVSLCRPLRPYPADSFIIEMMDVRAPSWNKLKRMYRYVWDKQVKIAKKQILTALNGRDWEMFNGRVDIDVIAKFKSRPVDSSNVPAKLYEDGLIGLLIKNDSPRYVRRVGTMSITGQTRPSVTVVISPVVK